MKTLPIAREYNIINRIKYVKLSYIDQTTKQHITQNIPYLHYIKQYNKGLHQNYTPRQTGTTTCAIKTCDCCLKTYTKEYGWNETKYDFCSSQCRGVFKNYNKNTTTFNVIITHDNKKY